MGFTKNGTFYYSLVSRKFNAFTAPIDQINGELKNELTKPMLGSIRHAEWSPDGKSLAFIKELWTLSRRPLFIMDLETGKERKLPDWMSVWHLRWSPDGKWIAYSPEKPVKIRPESTIWEADFAEILEKLRKYQKITFDTYRGEEMIYGLWRIPCPKLIPKNKRAGRGYSFLVVVPPIFNTKSVNLF